MARSSAFGDQRVLVTGAGGYVGHKLACALAEEGAHVIGLDINFSEDSLESFTCIQGDIRNKDVVAKACKGVHVVFHMASYGMSGREQLNREHIEEVNVQGTQHIIEGCCQQSVPYLIYTSTYNVVFGGQVIRDGDEQLPYLPLDKHLDHYSRTKSIAEQAVLKANGCQLKDGNSLRTCALRFSGIYGEGEKRHLPRIVSNIERGLFCFTYGQGDAIVDFVHVDNVVKSHVLAGIALQADHPVAAGEAYFISDGKPVNNFEFFRPLVQGLGYTFPKMKLPTALVYFIAFLTEIIYSVVGRYIFNFQPILTRTEGILADISRTHPQVCKTAITHYFSIQKAEKDLNYKPSQHSMDGIVRYFKERGHGKQPKRPSSVGYHLLNVVIGLMFVCLIFEWLPMVKSSYDWRL